MSSIAIVNLYRKKEGVSVAAKLYQQVLVKNGFLTDFYQCVEGKDEDYFQDCNIIRGCHLPNRYLERGINRAVIFPFQLRSLDQDLIFLSDPWLLSLTLFNRNIIVLVHDVRLLTKYTENAAQTIFFKLLISRLKTVKKIISISTTTKDALIGLGFNDSKIAVIPHCTDLDITAEDHIIKSLSKIKADEPLNVVYVAHDIPYKRISLFIKIAEKLTNFDPANRFRFTLLSRLEQPTINAIVGNNPAKLTVIDEVDDLKDFYEQADLMLFPSEYEGFGRPLLEAMKSGIPIVARDIPIVREIVNDAAHLIDSDCLDDWVNSLIDLYDEANYRRLALRSVYRSEEFSKPKFEQNVIDVFTNALNSE